MPCCGVGRSLKRGSDSLERIATLPHLAWGLRDIDGVADPERFLPCVSCLHPMLDAGAGQDGTLLFVKRRASRYAGRRGDCAAGVGGRSRLAVLAE